LRRDASVFAAAHAGSTKVVSFPAAGNSPRNPDNAWFPRRAWGWQIAAAAAVVFAAWTGFRNPPSIEPTPTPASDLRTAIVAANDGLRAAFVPGLASYASLEGDVVWSTAKQDGFLRLKGLPANDPLRSQYQLWIVDPERDAEFPVDGGVFDIPAGSEEALIRFQPRLPIGRPVAFVITQEIPGGVVKSRNPKPVAIAKI
jgi:Anti-sigma-K factor rskA